MRLSRHDLQDRLTIVWLVLVAASVVSFWLGTDHGFSGEDGKTIGTSIALAVAFLKIHLIGRHFMELRDAPLALQLAFGAWCAGVGGGVIALYVTG